jgi:MtaA/CmuA family methyltransferase
MTGLKRTLDFIQGKNVDHPPFHPILMRWAAKYGGVKYAEFCLDFKKKCQANIKCAEDFGIDWVTVMSDAYCEASAFGLQVEYPEDDLPLDRGGHLVDLNAVRGLKPYIAYEHQRPTNRINEVREYSKLVGEKYFILGWVEGPVAEYADLRGVSNASLDMYDDPDAVQKAMEVIVDAALEFITLQIKAGAHCIGIGDAFCSQIGPNLYRKLAFEGEKRMVEHIHNLGAIAKLHICGNTESILPDMIKTGANIIDVDHLVPSMSDFAGLLGPDQVFSGKSDPVTVIENGNAESIEKSVRLHYEQAGKRCIVSAGCEITPGTTTENMRYFHDSAKKLS